MMDDDVEGTREERSKHFLTQVSECGAILWGLMIFILIICLPILEMDSPYLKFLIKYNLDVLIGKKLRKHQITNSKNSATQTSVSKFASNKII
jgi:hypothetical protein